MAIKTYINQVKLLLSIIPEVARESCFALHGGTAINLFVRNMPRISVDIDLTYVPIEPRDTTLEHIKQALDRIKTRVAGLRLNLEVYHHISSAKLLISSNNASIKVEVNTVRRGLFSGSRKLVLCHNAQDAFEAYCAIEVVAIGQLYGGKICAALDRQHPRDLFDVKWFLDNEPISEEIKKGVLYSLLSSDRPIHEIIRPNFQDQRNAFINHFEGMTDELFTYSDYEQTRDRLVQEIHAAFNERDKEFLLSFEQTAPNWNIHDFQKFPSVRWKLQNLRKLRSMNPTKHAEQLDALRKKLYA
ncbi:MAG: nucleotidyl transferase AbiEii/AbiGii toxin family protein [Puniceicoccaceae bacterium]